MQLAITKIGDGKGIILPSDMIGTNCLGDTVEVNIEQGRSC